MNNIEVFGQTFVDWAEEIRRVANELQLNVQAESDAIRNYNNLKVCVQNSALDAELKAEMLEEINEIVAEELKHQNQLQELYSELTGIVAEEDGDDKGGGGK